jgi:hypothetical protein
MSKGGGDYQTSNLGNSFPKVHKLRRSVADRVRPGMWTTLVLLSQQDNASGMEA